MIPSCSRRPSTRPSSTTDLPDHWFSAEHHAQGGVSKRYRSFTAVDRLDLGIRRGEVFCLLGPNGSGKTTFIRMLAGYLSPSAGRLLVAGHDVVRDGLAAKRKIGYVPESVPLYGQMRVGEFLRFMARLRRMPTAAIEAAIHRVVELLALGDEPTNGLDPRQIMETRALIRSLAGRHTVLMSSHILSEVEKTADRAGLLLDGKLLGVRALAETPDLEAWFLSVT